MSNVYEFWDTVANLINHCCYEICFTKLLNDSETLDLSEH